MGASAWVSAAVGLVGALVGAAAGYLGAVRSARRAGSEAWAANALSLARALIDSEDAAQRALGGRLLEAGVGAVADAEDTPERIRAATRNPDLSLAVEDLRSLGGDPDAEQGAEQDVELDEGEGDAQEGRPRHP
ncbi:hypothetical protein WDZ17_14190 [Pseudokineococcus basanitobsidens]|uniref:Uncharacterized protein n=1 Tax=Pseudokineococcus basanitobsidens TaxID=1926649 RepID=A0ABU8RNC7_9ACTN